MTKPKLRKGFVIFFYCAHDAIVCYTITELLASAVLFVAFRMRID